ncbi:hypothetical protein PVAND_016587 [Polypedilum vanderplanki]|uniref:Uncharacterized protein n=1 Tax=Polypedilum vanderplanki TaxID=319348 RepID=A0A9J6BFV1_POLVA|nr:hypothetical protein PVAND_016587 [Polypedilum vanderplanki]
MKASIGILVIFCCISLYFAHPASDSTNREASTNMSKNTSNTLLDTNLVVPEPENKTSSADDCSLRFFCVITR